MIIDFHVHIFPDKLAARAVDILAKRAGIPAYTDCTVKGMLQKMDEAGIEHAVVQNIATNAKQTINVNNFAIETQKQEKRLTAFGSVHPESDWKSELDRLKDAGIKGIKLHPDYQDFFIDEPQMQPLYEYILKKDFILLFHTGIDYGLPDPIHATPERISHVLPMFEGEKVCLAHMGSFGMEEDAEKYILGKNVYLDTSCIGEFVGVDIFLKLLKEHRRDRLLFATDSPWTSAKDAKNMIMSFDIDDGFKNMILSENAKTLLGL